MPEAAWVGPPLFLRFVGRHPECARVFSVVATRPGVAMDCPACGRPIEADEPVGVADG